MVESVLGDITDDQVRMLPDFSTLVGFHLASEQLNECRLSGTVRPKNGNTRRKRDLECDIVELLDRRSRILEANLAHLQQTLLLGLDTLKKRRIRKLELVVIL